MFVVAVLDINWHIGLLWRSYSSVICGPEESSAVFLSLDDEHLDNVLMVLSLDFPLLFGWAGSFEGAWSYLGSFLWICYLLHFGYIYSSGSQS